MFKFFKRQLHVAIIVLVIFVVAPIMPRQKSEEIHAGIVAVMLDKMGVQKRHLDELIQGRRFADYEQHEQIREYALHIFQMYRAIAVGSNY